MRRGGRLVANPPGRTWVGAAFIRSEPVGSFPGPFVGGEGVVPTWWGGERRAGTTAGGSVHSVRTGGFIPGDPASRTASADRDRDDGTPGNAGSGYRGSPP